MRKIWIFVCTIFLFKIFLVNIYAEEIIETVRVGLEERYKNVDVISINNNDISIGLNNIDKFNSGANFRSENGFVIKKTTENFIQFGEYDTINSSLEVINMLETQGYTGVLAVLENNNYFVYVYSTDENINSIATKIGGTVLDSKTRNAIYNEDSILVVFEDVNIQISPIGEANVQLEDREYRGILEVLNTNNVFTLVNILPINEYLFGVVSAEMPASWDMEALKAQAVVARSYVMFNEKHNAHEDYTVCDTTYCQYYAGVEWENPRTAEAVLSTNNMILIYNNEPIEAVYYSSSGGVTANSEDVWIDRVEYLRSVEDIYEKEYADWTRTFSLNELNTLLRESGYNIGELKEVSTINFEDTTRVNKLVFIGANGIQELENEDIRSFFYNAVGGSLESRNFTILKGDKATNSTMTSDESVFVVGANGINQIYVSEINILDGDKNNENIYINGVEEIKVIDIPITNESTTGISDRITIAGKGLGHGVGMSQYGAKGMAEEGFKFDEILKFYYTGVDVK